MRIVDLVVPAPIGGTVAVSRAGLFPPLGLLSVATYARKTFDDVDIRIWDGNTFAESEIQIRPEAQVVGFSPTILSYHSCLRLATRAKSNGSLVVLGGYHASALGSRILQFNPFVDYVVVGDGEVPFTEILQGTPPAHIPGLMWRSDSGIRRNPTRRVSLDDYPVADRGLIDRAEYVRRFSAKYGQRGFHVPDLICSQKDCLWAAKTGGCVFCGRIDREYRARSPRKVWEEIIWLRDKYQTDYVWDISGSFVGSSEWVRAFHAARPKDPPVALEIYARAAEVNPEVAFMMKDIGVHKVFIGAESGDRRSLRSTGKGSTPEVNLHAVRLCNEHRMALSLGFVVGLPGETQESLARTLMHVKQLVSESEVETISCAVLLPTPGSRSFEMLLEHAGTAKKYATGDRWDIREMQEDWLSNFTSISYGYATEVAEEILSYAPTQSAIVRFKDSVARFSNRVSTTGDSARVLLDVAR